MMSNWKGALKTRYSAEEFREYIETITFGPWVPQRVILHNTGAPTLQQWLAGPPEPQRLDNLEHYYRDEKQWSAGPHLFVSPAGIWTFTPLNIPGVHSPSYNATSWGVEMVGDYDVEQIDPDVWANTFSALAALYCLVGLEPNNQTLLLHREDPRTQHRNCPGRNVGKYEMITAVQNLMPQVHQGEHPADRQV